MPGTSHVRGFSFGGSRDQSKNSGIYNQIKTENPGPGQYDLRSTLNKMSYSMRPKTSNPKSKERVPGPGSYEPPKGIQQFGNYFISKFLSSGATTFNPPTSQRFKTRKDHSPGPGAYNPKCQQMANDGNYLLSKYPSTLCRSFPKLRRLLNNNNHIKNRDNPGPGAYRAVSEFGCYEEQMRSRTQFKFEVPQKKIRPHSAVEKQMQSQITSKFKRKPIFR
eukprot:TRINITY_DN42891_c0_g1_i1.p2 TRINITY_DN42891_c0_g1~~TRINITY_DN42891_c0_g1_i1.p2  ORF type:complete len:220 (-),score=20.43 TRINITY_DN42891_c0_g1_i1:72-731(-)